MELSSTARATNPIPPQGCVTTMRDSAHATVPRVIRKPADEPKTSALTEKHSMKIPARPNVRRASIAEILPVFLSTVCANLLTDPVNRNHHLFRTRL